MTLFARTRRRAGQFHGGMRGGHSAAARVTATDNCDTNVDIIFTSTRSPEKCPFYITRCWTATDDCTNIPPAARSSKCGTAPADNHVSAERTLGCYEAVPPCAKDLSSSSRGRIRERQLPETVGVFLPEQLGGPNEVRFTYTVTDECTNAASCVQRFIILSNVPRGGLPAGLTVECHWKVPPARRISFNSLPRAARSPPPMKLPPDPVLRMRLQAAQWHGVRRLVRACPPHLGCLQQ